MCLPDGAEYWWGVKGKLRPQKIVTEEQRNADRQRNLEYQKKNAHDHRPKDVPDGTPNKWRCPICNQRVNKIKWKNLHE